MRNTGTEARIFNVLRDHAGQFVTHAMLMEALGLPSSSISGAGKRLADRPGNDVEKAGAAYIYRPSANGGKPAPAPLPVGTLLEVVGRSEAGRTIVRVEGGTCYVLGDVL